PLANPNAKSTSGARVLRIMKIDLQDLQVVEEFAYLTPDGSTYTPKVNQSSIFISDMFALDDDTILVDERDNKTVIKDIVEINVKKATNILDFTTNQDGKTLEQMSVTELQQAGIVFPSENVVLSL